MGLDIREWLWRGALGLGVVATVCYLATLATDEMSVSATSYFLVSVLAIAAAWLALRRWPARPMLLIWPVLDCLGMIGASQVAPRAAALTLAALVIAFLYVGLTQRQGTSALLMPLAIVAWYVVVDLPPGQLAVRLPLTVVVWVAVSELPAWLLTNLASARREVEHLAATDSLTGLSNRRDWDLWLRNLVDAGDPFAVLLIDLDHFKDYNDEHGHLAGDALLADFAHRLRQLAGPDEVVARWGGEEFAIAVVGAGRAEAEQLAQRILVSVPSHQTCSAGVAEHRPGEGALTLMARVDEALYAAKAGGRARLVVA